jgi:alpha-tubulin suppressor-like RCC1 family protein
MSVYAWGSNRFGQLGANITQNIQHEPIGVDINGQVAASVSCGARI